MGKQVRCGNPECGHTIECPETPRVDEIECPRCGTLAETASPDDGADAPADDDTRPLPAVTPRRQSRLPRALGLLGWALAGICLVALVLARAREVRERKAREERDTRLLERLLNSASELEYARSEDLAGAIGRLREVEEWGDGTPYERKARECREQLEKKQQGQQAFAKVRQQVEDLVKSDRFPDVLLALDALPPEQKALMPTNEFGELQRSMEQRARGRLDAILAEAGTLVTEAQLSEVQELLRLAGTYRIPVLARYVDQRLHEWRERVTRGKEAIPALVAMLQREPVPKSFVMPGGLEADFELPEDAKDLWGNPAAREISSTTRYPMEIRHKKTGMHLVFVPAGSFEMGSNCGRADERPVHHVTISRPFYAGKYEVTVAQFRQFIEATQYQTDAEREGRGCVCIEGRWQQSKEANWKVPHLEQTDNHPVTLVTLHDAQVFVQWLNDGSKLKFGLPTEAQWEYLARAGLRTKWFWGGSEGEVARYGNTNDESTRGKLASRARIGDDDGHVATAPVGRFRPNPLGLYDTVGNVWEWCQDEYRDAYYAESPETDPVNLSEANTSTRRRDLRVIRGGSWATGPDLARPANRGRLDHGAADVGLRVVASLQEKTE